MRALSLALALQLQIPTPVGYVNDFAGVIDDASRQALLAVIDEVRQKSGGEIVVVTLKDLGGRASIDVALVNGILNLNPRRACILAELARVLRPGGSAYVAELILSQPLPEDVKAREANWFS